MEWRCEWCGKPHEEDDPPCDNCGHGTFERAVVQEPAAVANESTTVWVCTECGREHVKHAPPCSRCGNATLERREQTVADSELQAPGYRDLVTPRYLLGVGVALALGLVLLLGIAGVINLPGMDSGVPAVDDVPGDAESYDGVSLTAVEDAYVDAFNDRLRRTDRTALARDDRVDDVARFYNQRQVKAAAGTGALPPDDRVVDLLGGSCSGSIGLVNGTTAAPTDVESAESLGDDLAAQQFARGEVTLPPDASVTGVDVHVADGSVYVTQFVC